MDTKEDFQFLEESVARKHNPTQRDLVKDYTNTVLKSKGCSELPPDVLGCKTWGMRKQSNECSMLPLSPPCKMILPSCGLGLSPSAEFSTRLTAGRISIKRDIKKDENIPLACKGCSNYHGEFYKDTQLICGIHPYGWLDDNCPDFEVMV
jgi:hypothetical protein